MTQQASRSVVERFRFSERADIARYTDWFDEVAEGVRLARSEHPDVPVHLVGHCFGANLALGSILTHNLEVRSLVMLTPGLFIRPDYGVVNKARIMASGLL